MGSDGGGTSCQVYRAILESGYTVILCPNRPFGANLQWFQCSIAVSRRGPGQQSEWQSGLLGGALEWRALDSTPSTQLYFRRGHLHQTLSARSFGFPHTTYMNDTYTRSDFFSASPCFRLTTSCIPRIHHRLVQDKLRRADWHPGLAWAVHPSREDKRAGPPPRFVSLSFVFFSIKLSDRIGSAFFFLYISLDLFKAGRSHKT
ncbi:hypothetical protein GGR54DRAFT_504768 [Hypoxylon sp. NC1633]|nr:hypothetical protein GGR54DRAFT_504768 [Hypoxylon sp. NC1633]